MNFLKFVPSNVTSVFYTDETDWLNERRKGIGGSDVSVVMGLNKYKSKLRLYKEKVEGLTEDTSENVFIKKGKDLEDLIRIKYCEPYFRDIGYTVLHPDVMLVNTENPIFRANLDGFAVPVDGVKDYTKNIVVEIKWVSELGEANWDNEDEYCGIPANYYAQVQEYMYVTGARKAIVCALFDSDWKVRFYKIPYNVDFVSKMIVEATNFMNVHVNCKIPPRLDSSLDKDFVLESVKSTPVTMYPEPDMDEKIVLYKELKSNIKTLEKGLNNLTSEITEMYLKGARPTSPLLKINISKVSSKRFDASEFEKAYPELYKQYIKESEYTRTTIK